MKPNSLSEQTFSVLVAILFVSSGYLLLVQETVKEEYEMRVPVWARGQLDYETTQPYSFVLNQGTYELLETDNEFESVHVMIPYDLPLSEGGAAASCQFGGECPQISLAYWRPKVPSGMKVPVIAEFGPYFGETSASTPDVSQPGGWLGVSIIQNLLPHGFAFAQVSVTGTGNSNHCMDLMGFAEQEGINAAVEWLATQEWSNGNVGMIGKSYDGSTPWQAAMYGNEYLKTIVPISGLIGVRELMWKNGSSEARAPFMHNVVYGSYGYEADKEEQNLQNACPDYLASSLYGGEAYVFGGSEVSGYWDERYFLGRVLENYRGSVYIVQGFHDWNVDPHMAVPVINTLLDTGIEAKVLLGQWDHDYPDRPDYQKQRSDPGRGSEAYPQMVRFDWMQDLLEWFTYYLQERGPKPSLYSEIQNNRGEWRVEERYPAKDSRVIEMPLGGSNLSLVAESVLGTSVYPGMEATNDQVVFETSVFNSDFRFGGLPQLHLDVTPAGPGGSIYALMEDCSAENECIHIGHAIMDLRYHEGGTEYQNIIPGVEIRAKMEFFAMDVLIPEGHKIRLSLRDIGEDYLPPSTEAAVDISISGNSVLRIHEINTDGKIFFEPPVCMHEDCLSE
ncbi:MAG: CocE/NonD family hydrolase [Candidatus Thermoplasmatota archaeon]|nr:CocE/NonD family hydrolase [Candidatus Thermoplasmatota archaeon]MEC7349786.1 CocE/NonD family hydrolase [Candidatus Thermoplasmatota archaeon]